MRVHELKQSNYLSKEDCGNGILVTIKDCIQENIAKEGAPQEMRYILYFDEQEKGLVLNSTNGQIIQAITGSDDSDHWTGKKIVLYHDPNVSFGGKLVGGIRARAPRNQAAKPAPAPVPRPIPAPTRSFEQEQAAPEDDSTPF